MDFKNRMKYAVAYLKAQNIITSQNEMRQVLGYNESSFSQIINGRVPFSKNMINKIKQNYPQLNTKWLLTGEGEMLNHHHNDATNNTNRNNMNSFDSYSQDKINENNIYIEMIATQRELISQYRKEIEYLRRKIKENTENS